MALTACCNEISKICFAQRQPTLYHIILMLLFLVPDVKVIALHLNNKHLVGRRLLV